MTPRRPKRRTRRWSRLRARSRPPIPVCSRWRPRCGGSSSRACGCSRRYVPACRSSRWYYLSSCSCCSHRPQRLKVAGPPAPRWRCLCRRRGSSNTPCGDERSVSRFSCRRCCRTSTSRRCCRRRRRPSGWSSSPSSSSSRRDGSRRSSRSARSTATTSPETTKHRQMAKCELLRVAPAHVRGVPTRCEIASAVSSCRAAPASAAA
mmetsp:Transcript_55706/g.121303  ORF Transcript_55706/g.121303 Transcript_55706/m.121303 type:complete len:206 (+) Transcript_55706:654-1271(+)